MTDGNAKVPAGTNLYRVGFDKTFFIEGSLTELDLSYAGLVMLDVSQSTTLEKLICEDNKLTALDLSHNSALTSLWCFNNQILTPKMETLINSLPTVTDGDFRVVKTPGELNEITQAQVAAATAKGWIPRKSTGSVISFE